MHPFVVWSTLWCIPSWMFVIARSDSDEAIHIALIEVWIASLTLAMTAVLKLHSRPQRFFGKTGDLLVAVRKCYEFIVADDVTDGGKGPIVGALKHLAQNSVGRIGAVGENDARRCLQTLLFVSREGGNGIGIGNQGLRHRPRVENGLARAIGTARHHRMCRIAQ